MFYSNEQCVKRYETGCAAFTQKQTVSYLLT